MSLFHAMGLIVTLVALFGYFNCRVTRLPDIKGRCTEDAGNQDRR